MTPVNSNNFTTTIATILRSGGVGVLRTDTLYGLVARADNPLAVERIYALKKRTPTKSPIVLIASTDQLFDTYGARVTDRLKTMWPGKNSIILPSTAAPEWISRGNGSVAYRMPDSEALRNLIEQTGPLIAPSANFEGEAPAITINEAKAYFANNVDFYVDGGTVADDSPSKLYIFSENNDMERLR